VALKADTTGDGGQPDLIVASVVLRGRLKADVPEDSGQPDLIAVSVVSGFSRT
jgi:hypothetical protein